MGFDVSEIVGICSDINSVEQTFVLKIRVEVSESPRTETLYRVLS